MLSVANLPLTSLGEGEGLVSGCILSSIGCELGGSYSAMAGSISLSFWPRS